MLSFMSNIYNLVDKIMDTKASKLAVPLDNEGDLNLEGYSSANLSLLV